MHKTALDSEDRYILANYTDARPFSSFLPGIAGPMGIPMWVFYVNRGQAISSFGVVNKNQPLMEFQPANKSYQLTPYTGFRTFIKRASGGKLDFYEPFSARSDPVTERTMFIGSNDLEIQEVHKGYGLQVNVLYFTLTGEPFAGLVRQTQIKNLSDQPQELEILDGMPALIPNGVDNWGLKQIARTLEAWMEVSNLEQAIPFFKLRATAGDTAEVGEIQAGHFAFAFLESARAAPDLIPPLVDPQVVFRQNTALSAPDGFLESGASGLQSQNQITSGRTPCAFFGAEDTLEAGGAVTLHSVYGHISGIENLLREAHRVAGPTYLAGKRTAARRLVQDLTQTVRTQTASPLFDAYAAQTFLDNVLRGGWPTLLGDHVYHLYSRKHGDPERDYNDFFLAAEFYSQGNGNFRDVAQNRRSDVLFEPRVGAHNIRTFLSLIQLDGYNPLVVDGTTYSLPPDEIGRFRSLAASHQKLLPLLESQFTPGKLLKTIWDYQIELAIPAEEFLAQVMSRAKPQIEAVYGEGFWIDHWTYLLDLVENYLAVFPDRKNTLLFDSDSIPFYVSPAQVRPRRERYVLTESGPRQYNAVDHAGEAHWAHTPAGERLTVTLFGKLLILAAVKFGTRDPAGMGIEMEAGKPGWYDALNGLPGLFGSSMPETYELIRLIRFLREAIAGTGLEMEVAVPVEFAEYLEALYDLTASGPDPFSWWDAANRLRETYRDRIYSGITGQETRTSASKLDQILDLFETRLHEGVRRAEQWKQNDLVPTYFRFIGTEIDGLRDNEGKPLLDEQARPYIRVNRFQPVPLPPFLEGPVRALKIAAGKEQAADLHAAVLAGPLYDKKLNMFKVNAALHDESHEIGRARAFTPGWLENESIWLHMEYKYLLELLKTGLYEAFWEAAQTCLIPFQDPARYGRSILENSSFIVSSAHPDVNLHGGGFVARLSGSTAEFMEMWTILMAGRYPFRVHHGELILNFHPVLPGRMFDEQDTVSFNFLGFIPVQYYNPSRMDTWRLKSRKIELQLSDGQTLDFKRQVIPAPYAKLVRERKVDSISVELG